MAQGTYEVAVVGAGFAGLAAATALRQAGHDVVVYEARNRPGGRVWSETVDTVTGPVTIERGAEFVLHGYDTLGALCQSYGLDLVDTGMSYYIRELFETPHITIEDVAEAGQQAADLVETLPQHATVADVLAKLDIRPELRHALQARVEISAAAPVEEVAARALFDVASFKPLPSFRIGGGNQSLALVMAAEMGDRIRYEHVVESVTHDGDKVAVTVDGTTELYDKVVVAVPFGVLRQESDLVVEMSTQKHDVLQSLIQGHAGKIHIALDQSVATSAIMSVAGRFWTWSATDQTDQVPAMLNGFIGSLSAMEKLNVLESASDLEQAVLATRPGLPVDTSHTTIVTQWATDQFALGAYSAASPNGNADDWKVLEQPHGGIYFAGEYAEPVFTGLMEGALRSGLRAAKRITDNIVDIDNADVAGVLAR